MSPHRAPRPSPGTDAGAALLRHQKVPRPVAWTIHAADVAEFADIGKRCEARRCREPVTIVTWRWWRSAEVGRVLLAEHLVCLDHGRQFAERHHVQVEPPPARPSSSRRRRAR